MSRLVNAGTAALLLATVGACGSGGGATSSSSAGPVSTVTAKNLSIRQVIAEASSSSSGTVPRTSEPAQPQALGADLQAAYAALTCGGASVASNATNSDRMVACGQQQPIKYILEPATSPTGMDGATISSAKATLDSGSDAAVSTSWIIEVTFTPAGQSQWSDLTARVSATPGCPESQAPACQLAFVLDGVVLSSPIIDARISGPAQITGNFTEQSAKALAAAIGGG